MSRSGWSTLTRISRLRGTGAIRIVFRKAATGFERPAKTGSFASPPSSNARERTRFERRISYCVS